MRIFLFVESILRKQVLLLIVLQVVLAFRATAQLSPEQLGSKWGYVNAKGEVVIQPKFDSAGAFSEGLAKVEKDKKYGYINESGTVVIAPRYFAGGPFKDGYAWVLTSKPLQPLGKGEYGVALFGKVTYIDRTGRQIRPPFSAEHVRNFSDGLAAVRPGNITGGCGGKAGYLDTRGQWKIKPQFDDGGDFSEGLAPVNVGAKCHIGGKWGYIDLTGKAAISFKYNFATPFKNGKACVSNGRSWMLITKNDEGTPVGKADCLSFESDE